MNPIRKRWRLHPTLPEDVASALADYHPILRQILFNRGIRSAEQARQYLQALPPPGTEAENLRDLPQAVERIRRAIRKGETIAIYGDYDADGVTATALLVGMLEKLGTQVRGYIPNRFDEGYGLNVEALDALRAEGVSLVITVDCGIRSIQEADHARQIGLDLIISDHHHPAQELPTALAVINPKQPADAYPDKDLAGVGLAYKLASAMLPTPDEAAETLDLVALGTVTDIAPLVGENRALVRAGLERLRQPHRQGVMALIGAAGLKPGQINAGHIGYVLGPRLNAAGRLDSALAALSLLLETDVARAASLAQTLNIQNQERQQITREIQARAEQIAQPEETDELLLFAAHPEFNPGVVGLAASRLVETYYRPAIVAHIGETYTRGSCRSIPEFHITQALDECADLLEHHGGHAAAAGFTVRNEKLEELIQRLKHIAASRLAGMDLRPVLRADLELPLSALRPELLEYLDWLQPTGHKNPEATFISRDLAVKAFKAVGRDGAHLRLVVTDGWITFDAIGFNLGHWAQQMPRRVDLLYSFELNEYNGKFALQLNLRDLKPSETED